MSLTMIFGVSEFARRFWTSVLEDAAQSQYPMAHQMLVPVAITELGKRSEGSNTSRACVTLGLNQIAERKKRTVEGRVSINLALHFVTNLQLKSAKFLLE
jgi:hypothetical protein